MCIEDEGDKSGIPAGSHVVIVFCLRKAMLLKAADQLKSDVRWAVLVSDGEIKEELLRAKNEFKVWAIQWGEGREVAGLDVGNGAKAHKEGSDFAVDVVVSKCVVEGSGLVDGDAVQNVPRVVEERCTADTESAVRERVREG